MSINKILNSLEKSWERDDILLKIKNGLDTDKIVNEFLASNELQIILNYYFFLLWLVPLVN